MEEHRYQSQKRTYTQFLEHKDSSEARHIGRNSPTASSSTSSTVSARLADLCARCKTIDLVGLFDEKSERIKTDLGKFVVDLESSVEQLKAANCPLCQLLRLWHLPMSTETDLQEFRTAICVHSPDIKRLEISLPVNFSFLTQHCLQWCAWKLKRRTPAMTGHMVRWLGLGRKRGFYLL